MQLKWRVLKAEDKYSVQYFLNRIRSNLADVSLFLFCIFILELANVIHKW